MDEFKHTYFVSFMHFSPNTQVWGMGNQVVERIGKIESDQQVKELEAFLKGTGLDNVTVISFQSLKIERLENE